MAELMTAEISCGVRQLCDLRCPPKDTLIQIFRDSDEFSYEPLHKISDINFAMIIFSDNTNRGKRYGGKALAKFIKTNKLGKVVESDLLANPNSGNKIRTWIWQLNRASVLKWVKANVDHPQDGVGDVDRPYW